MKSNCEKWTEMSKEIVEGWKEKRKSLSKKSKGSEIGKQTGGWSFGQTTCTNEETEK